MIKELILAYFASWKIFSVLKASHEKMEALAFGDSSIWEDLSNIYTLRNVIKILGIYFGGNVKERDEFMEVERFVAFGEDTDS